MKKLLLTLLVSVSLMGAENPYLEFPLEKLLERCEAQKSPKDWKNIAPHLISGVLNLATKCRIHIVTNRSLKQYKKQLIPILREAVDSEASDLHKINIETIAKAANIPWKDVFGCSCRGYERLPIPVILNQQARIHTPSGLR